MTPRLPYTLYRLLVQCKITLSDRRSQSSLDSHRRQRGKGKGSRGEVGMGVVGRGRGRGGMSEEGGGGGGVNVVAFVDGNVNPFCGVSERVFRC